jgi:hypothetical protein
VDRWRTVEAMYGVTGRRWNDLATYLIASALPSEAVSEKKPRSLGANLPLPL